MPIRTVQRTAWLQAASVALLLIGGVSSGFFLGAQSQKPQPFHLVEIEKGDPLFAAISDTRSGQTAQLSNDVSIKPVLTFQSADGRFCREVELDQRENAAIGIACLSGDSWRWIALLESEGPPNPNGYATVGDFTAMELEKVIDRLGGETPFSPADERKLIDSNWRTEQSVK